MSLLRPTRTTPPTADLRSLADEELMQLVRENEAAAFEIIYERHVDAAFSLAYRMCGIAPARRGRRAGGVRVDVAQRRAL